MSKRFEIDGKFYRERRGKLVEIPEVWVGVTVYDQEKRKRFVASNLRHGNGAKPLGLDGHQNRSAKKFFAPARLVRDFKAQKVEE